MIAVNVQRPGEDSPREEGGIESSQSDSSSAHGNCYFNL